MTKLGNFFPGSGSESCTEGSPVVGNNGVTRDHCLGGSAGVFGIREMENFRLTLHNLPVRLYACLTVLASKHLDVWAEFVHQSKNPPGGDEVISACYAAVVKLKDRKLGFKKRIEKIFKDRGLTRKHLVNLFFRGVQYIWLFEEGGKNYPEKYKKVAEWEKELDRIIDGPSGKVLFEILGSRDTGTTVYQRYIGPKAILSALAPGKKLAIADLGCGGNHGLPGLMDHEEFKPLIDHSPKKVISAWVKRPIGFKSGLGVDKHDPYDPESINWRVACSFYPSELAEMTEFLSFEKRVRSIGEQIFVKGDIKTLTSHLPVAKKYDGVILSTVLYQLRAGERKMVLTEARMLLKPDGVLIVQDFARKNEIGSELEFSGPWFGKGFGYRTFVLASWTGRKFWEVLQFKNGRCKEVRPGEDFDRFFGILSKDKEMGVRASVNFG